MASFFQAGLAGGLAQGRQLRRAEGRENRQIDIQEMNVQSQIQQREAQAQEQQFQRKVKIRDVLGAQADLAIASITELITSGQKTPQELRGTDTLKMVFDVISEIRQLETQGNIPGGVADSLLTRLNIGLFGTVEPTTAGKERAELSGEGVELTDAQKRKQIGAGDPAPNVVNVFFPDTGVTRGIDLNDPVALADMIARQGQIRGINVTGTPGEFSTQPKEIADFTASIINTRSVLNEAKRLEDLLDSGLTFTSAAGGLTRFAEVIRGQAEQFGNLFGTDDLSLLDATYDFNAFGAAELTAAFRSNVISLGYMLARQFEPQGQLNEGDIQRGIARIAANSGSTALIRASLNEVKRSTIAFLDIIAKERARRDPENAQQFLLEFVAPDLLLQLSEFEKLPFGTQSPPSGGSVTNPDPARFPDGTIFIDEITGARSIKRGPLGGGEIVPIEAQ